MKNRRTIQRLALAALLLLPAAARPAQAPASGKKGAFFWKVDNGQAQAYLLGSIHAGRADFYPLAPQIERAFDRSDLLAVEVNIDALQPEALMASLASKALYMPPDHIGNHLSPETLQALTARLQSLGLPLEPLRQMKPWMISLAIAGADREKQGVQDQHGIDRHFLDRAKAAAKPVVDMEYAGDQLSLLADVSDRDQEEMLKDVLADPAETAAELEKVVTAWKSGDDAALEAILLPWKKDPAQAGLYRKMFDLRNQKMAAQVEEFLRSGRVVFVVVGAGHLVGEGSVIDLLRRTCRVERL